MFTGGFSPSTYCQQFKALSAATLYLGVCVPVHVHDWSQADNERFWRGRYGHGAVEEIRWRVSKNLNAAVVAECDACRPSCQNKCGLFMPQQTGLLKANILVLTLYIFVLSTQNPPLLFYVQIIESLNCPVQLIQTLYCTDGGISMFPHRTGLCMPLLFGVCANYPVSP